MGVTTRSSCPACLHQLRCEGDDGTKIGGQTQAGRANAALTRVARESGESTHTRQRGAEDRKRCPERDLPLFPPTIPLIRTTRCTVPASRSHSPRREAAHIVYRCHRRPPCRAQGPTAQCYHDRWPLDSLRTLQHTPGTTASRHVLPQRRITAVKLSAVSAGNTGHSLPGNMEEETRNIQKTKRGWCTSHRHRDSRKEAVHAEPCLRHSAFALCSYPPRTLRLFACTHADVCR